MHCCNCVLVNYDEYGNKFCALAPNDSAAFIGHHEWEHRLCPRENARRVKLEAQLGLSQGRCLYEGCGSVLAKDDALYCEAHPL